MPALKISVGKTSSHRTALVRDLACKAHRFNRYDRRCSVVSCCPVASKTVSRSTKLPLPARSAPLAYRRPAGRGSEAQAGLYIQRCIREGFRANRLRYPALLSLPIAPLLQSGRALIGKKAKTQPASVLALPRCSLDKPHLFGRLCLTKRSLPICFSL